MFGQLGQVVLSRPSIALFGSVVLGALFTFAWAQTLHWSYRDINPDYKRQRSISIAAISGCVERALITTGVIWIPQTIGPIAGAWLVARALLAWAGLDAENISSRVRFSVSTINTAVSFLWAVAWGIWGSLPQST